MALADEEPAAAGPEQAGDDARPRGHVGDPAERADAREDDVKGGRGQDAEGVVDGGLDEVSLFAAGPLRGRDELARLREGGGRKVEPGDGGGAAAREGQGVGANVALQVRDALAGEVAKEGNVKLDNVGEVVGIRDKVFKVVVWRCGVLSSV
ncbi:hypothetical protein PWT90_10899 [Aphanocladium album]|nr:hypothetical protein PWT90_10899 [Aphanocladium album]